VSEVVPVPGWYAAMIGPPCAPLEEAVARRFGRDGRVPAWLERAARRFGPVAGALVWVATRDAPAVGLIRNSPGTGTVLALDALRPRRRRRRRIVLFEFIGHEPSRRAPVRIARRAWAWLEGLAMRRSVAAAHVLTEGERGPYARLYRLPVERFRHVPWPLSRTGAEIPAAPEDSRRVVSSGRAYCDWDTLLAAAAGRDWELTLICGEEEHAQVREKAAGIAAEVLCELTREEHDARLREAAVYALVLRETAVSAGQVRLTAAVDSGTPVVAAAVPALDGYAEKGTAVLVPPADPEALGGAVDRLLADRSERLRLREAAIARARGWTYEDYFGAMGELLAEVRENERA
jgi:glycosyltransferase involved in cell wall biosynthesis